MTSYMRQTSRGQHPGTRLTVDFLWDGVVVAKAGELDPAAWEWPSIEATDDGTGVTVLDLDTAPGVESVTKELDAIAAQDTPPKFGPAARFCYRRTYTEQDKDGNYTITTVDVTVGDLT